MIADTKNVTAAGNSDVLAALRVASRQTGLDFDYLLHTAMRESSLDTQAKSKTSSAAGLFQFIEQTWLGLVKRYGERHGLGSYAGAIQETGNGRYRVDSSETKAAILALRQNPVVSAMMAGESAKETKQSLECALGREVCGGELYAAHFLGPSAARHLIELNERDPEMRADLALPQAAKANRAAFYHADGTAKTVGELYAWAVDSTGPHNPPVAPKDAPAQMIGAIRGARLAIDVAAEPAEPERVVVTAERGAGDDAVSVPAARAKTHWMAPDNAALTAPRTLPRPLAAFTPGLFEIFAAFSPMSPRRAG
jgi:hypothetical protein